jgi:hypothetical protein
VNIDPSTNVVVFAVKREGLPDKLVGQGPTRSPDCIQRIWAELSAKYGVVPADIRQIYTEWQPSAEDAAFLDATFAADLQVAYSFQRPADDGWDEAMREVERSIRESAIKKQAAEAMAQPDEAKGQLLPILRTIDANDSSLSMIVGQPIGANLAIFLGRVGWTPHKTIGTHYFMRNDLKSGESPAALFEQAAKNLIPDLKIEGFELDGEPIVRVRHALDMGTSILGLLDFHEQAAGWLETPELCIAFCDPSTLFITALTSSKAIKGLQQDVQASDYWGATYLTPACYSLDKDGLRLISKRTKQAEQ